MSGPRWERIHPDGVREIGPADPDATVCGWCGRGWDDDVVTGRTPAPGARCPFEYDHPRDGVAPAFVASVGRGAVEHGTRWDPSDLYAAPVFAGYFDGPRVRVTTTYPSGSTWTRCGRVSRTTGWRPAFLLMARAGAHGSTDVLGPADVVTAVRDGSGRYRPTGRGPVLPVGWVDADGVAS